MWRMKEKEGVWSKTKKLQRISQLFTNEDFVDENWNERCGGNEEMDVEKTTSSPCYWHVIKWRNETFCDWKRTVLTRSVPFLKDCDNRSWNNIIPKSDVKLERS